MDPQVTVGRIGFEVSTLISEIREIVYCEDASLHTDDGNLVQLAGDRRAGDMTPHATHLHWDFL